MTDKFDAFEHSMRNVLKDYEVPFNEASWEELKGQIPGGSAWTNPWTIAAIFAGLLTVGATSWYFLSSDNGTMAQAANPTDLVINKDTYEGIRSKTEQYLLAVADNSGDMISFEDAVLASEEAANANDSRGTQLAVNNTTSNTTQPTSTEETESLVSADVIDTAEEELVGIPAEGDKPAIPISISTRKGCVGTTVEFNISLESEDGNYLWNFGDGNFSNQPNPTHTYLKAGTYDITLSVTSNDDGVIRTKTMDNLIVINPTPEADFDWSFVDSTSGTPTVRFNNRSARAQDSEWVIVDQISTDINPTEAINKKGVHVIELVVSNEFGCSDTKARTISVNADYALMAPSQFSPDGDGVFDSFMPRAFMDDDMNFDLKIYSGDEVVFHTTDADNPWKGQLPDGSTAQKGKAYSWVAIVKDLNGEKYYSGTITITP